MKNENTDTINRAIHSAVGKCWHKSRKARSTMLSTEGRICDLCGETWHRFGGNAERPPKLPDYTIPGQPLEDAKAWAVKKVGILEFGYLVLKYSGQHTNTNRYYPIGLAATLPAFDMANIIFGLINEAEDK